MRHRQVILILILLALALIPVAAGCGDDEPADGGTDAASTATAPATIQLTTSDGLDLAMELVSCVNQGESDLMLTARTETADLTVTAADQTGPVMLRAAQGDREGRAQTVVVGDTGIFRVTGLLTLADDTAQPATFELTGTCVV